MLLNDKVFYELFIVSFTKHLDPFKFLNFMLEFTFNLKRNFSQIYLQLFYNKWNNFFQSNSGTPKVTQQALIVSKSVERLVLVLKQIEVQKSIIFNFPV